MIFLFTVAEREYTWGDFAALAGLFSMGSGGSRAIFHVIRAMS